jgi:hypothetical protein
LPLLVGNNLPSQLANLLNVTVFELGLRHVNRALMMRHHHLDKITIDVTARPIIMSVIIFFMAVAFSERNERSSGSTVRVLVGSCAKANEVAVIDAVVASESTRLRMKQRENNTIVTSGHYQPLPARMAPRPSLVFPRYLFEG